MPYSTEDGTIFLKRKTKTIHISICCLQGLAHFASQPFLILIYYSN